MSGDDVLVLAILSRLIGDYHSRDCSDLDAQRRALVYYAAAPEAPAPSVRVPGRAAAGALSDMGLRRADVNDDWEPRRALDGATAVLSADRVEAIFPRELWPIVLEVACDGPGPAVARMQAAMYHYSLREVQATRARPAGRVGDRAVRAIYEAFRRLLVAICELRALDRPDTALAGWSGRPMLRMPRTSPRRTDRSAVPRPLLRAVIHRLNQEVHTRLGAPADELAVIATAPIVKLTHAGLFKPMRMRLILALLATTGMRVGSLTELRCSDYEPAHRFPDGEVGPALRVTHLKGKHPDFARWKGLHDREALLVEGFMLLARRLYTEREQTVGCSWRKVETPRAMVPDAYLIPSGIWTPERASNATAISHRLGGSANSSLPLLPKCSAAEVAADPALAQEGYSVHCVKHSAEPLIADACEVLLCKRGRPPAIASRIAQAALDHKVPADPYGYADMSSEAGREVWTRFGVHAASEWLWTDRGARRVPDVGAFTELVRARIALEARVESLGHARRKLEAKARFATAVADVAQLLAAIEEERRAREDLRELEVRCARLRDDRATWRAVPDDQALSDQDGWFERLEEVERRLRQEAGEKCLPANVRRLPTPARDDGSASSREAAREST